jgi:hypothetical protein
MPSGRVHIGKRKGPYTQLWLLASHAMGTQLHEPKAKVVGCACPLVYPRGEFGVGCLYFGSAVFLQSITQYHDYQHEVLINHTLLKVKTARDSLSCS